MKRAIALAAAAIIVTPALADAPAKPVCVDPHFDYQARFLSGSDIVVRQTLGHDRRALKLTTTCTGLRKNDTIRLSAEFSCIGLGDGVFSSKIDGHQEGCRVSHVAPYDGEMP